MWASVSLSMELLRWFSTSVGSGGGEVPPLSASAAPSSEPIDAPLDREDLLLMTLLTDDLWWRRVPAAVDGGAVGTGAGIECLVLRRLYSDTMDWIARSVTIE